MKSITLDEYLDKCTTEELQKIVNEAKEEIMFNPSIVSKLNASYLISLIEERLQIIVFAEYINSVFKRSKGEKNE